MRNVVFVAVLEDGPGGLEVLGATIDRTYVAKTAADLLARSLPLAGPMAAARRSLLEDLAFGNAKLA